KRIEHFLHAYQFNRNDADVEKCLYGLLQYIDHASEAAVAEAYAEPMYT
ncbi:YhdB family protein, partial [Bacillus altitudinis]